MLLITNIFPPEIGGPASFIDRLAHAMASGGHLVTVVCASADAEDSDRARPFIVRRIARNNRIVFEAAVRARIAREMARHKSILVNGLEHQAAHAAAVLGKRYVVKIVGDSVWEAARNSGLTTLSIDDFQHVPTLGEQRILVERRQHVLQRASAVIVPSEYLRRLVIGWGVAPERVTTIFNGVESTGAQPRRRDGQRLRVLFVGRLTNWKGVETLILAVRGLRDVTVTIVGDGPELPLLIEFARQSGTAPQIEFRGRLSPPDVAAAMHTHDVLVLGSSYEGLSHTLLEASAAGLACVASDAGGNPEIIDGATNGLLFPYGDVDALRNALESLQKNEDRRLSLAEGALAASRRFSFDITVQQTISLLIDGSTRT